MLIHPIFSAKFHVLSAYASNSIFDWPNVRPSDIFISLTTKLSRIPNTFSKIDKFKPFLEFYVFIDYFTGNQTVNCKQF